jgi:hypothetical protein
MSSVDGHKQTYLSVCAIYRQEGPYLQEWIEFHRLVGVERFYLYNNRSTDDHRTVLADYIDEGIVILHEWPVYGAFLPAFDNCLRTHAGESRWIGFIDIDEFLFSPTGTLVSEVLRDYEAFPGVGVNRMYFGPSGHRVRPDGLVIESYLRRGRLGGNLRIHSIVNPRATIRCIDYHDFEYETGTSVDENYEPIESGWTKGLSVSRLRINHYWTRSEAEFKDKQLDRPRKGRPGIAKPRGPMPTRRVFDKFDLEHDETILRYLPALREALARRAGRAAGAPVADAADSPN